LGLEQPSSGGAGVPRGGRPLQSSLWGADTEASLEWLWRDPTAPALLQVKLNTYTNLYPKIAFGRPITEMELLAKPLPDWSAAPDDAPDLRSPVR